MMRSFCLTRPWPTICVLRLPQTACIASSDQRQDQRIKNTRLSAAGATMKGSSFAVACLLVAMLFAGALAEPRKLLEAGADGADLSEANEHQRILAELEEVHQLRERMLQQAATYTSGGSGAPAPAPGPAESESPTAESTPAEPG